MSLLKDQINEGNLAAIRQGAEQQQVQREQLSANKLFTNDLIEENDELLEKNKKLEAENLFYKNLLTKPHKEIAELTGGAFEEAYDEQQATLGAWVVSQRAFKEIAIRYGLEMGISKEDTLSTATKTEQNVMDNQTEHDNNFNKSDWEIYYAPRVKVKRNLK